MAEQLTALDATFLELEEAEDGIVQVGPKMPAARRARRALRDRPRLLQGLGLCVAECPCGAIEMVPEQI